MALNLPNNGDSILGYDIEQTNEINKKSDDLTILTNRVDTIGYSFQPIRTGSGVASYTNRQALKVGNVVVLSLAGTYTSGAGNKVLGNVIGSMIPTTAGGRTLQCVSITDAYGVHSRIASIDGTGNITVAIGSNDQTFVINAMYFIEQ